MNIQILLLLLSLLLLLLESGKPKKSRNIFDCTVYTAIVMVNDSKCAKSELMIEYREQCEHPHLQPGLANNQIVGCIYSLLLESNNDYYGSN